MPPDPLPPPRRQYKAAFEAALEEVFPTDRPVLKQEDLKLPIDANKRKGKKAESTSSR